MATDFSKQFLALPFVLLCFLAGCSQQSDEVENLHRAVSICGVDAADFSALAASMNVHIQLAEQIPATESLPAHCLVDAQINPRVGLDGQHYSINFRLRMPTENWNGRLYMGGGGGTNGRLVDPVSMLAEGFATLGTDSGHDNEIHNDPQAGGTAAFGVDPQARIDFAYNSYDQVTRIGKLLISTFYGEDPAYSYFVGCSEGGREALLMSQRFPEHFDGIISGAPVLHLPLGPMAGVYTTQLFAGLAQRQGVTLPNGEPAIGRTYSNPDLNLVRGAVLAACDRLDGLADGIVDNWSDCHLAQVNVELQALICDAEKTADCLTEDQIDTLKLAFAGPVDSEGTALYSDWPWDGGISGFDGTNYNTAWRSGWIGSPEGDTNSAGKLRYAPVLAVIYSTPPGIPIAPEDALSYSLAYDFDEAPALIYASNEIYQQSAADLLFTDWTDLSAFRDSGGKLMIYHGASDASISMNDTLNWYRAMDEQMGGQAAEFARLYLVPGMNHCSGGPATDSFDMLPQLMDWVEQGVVPEAVVASASNPGYFGVEERTRPLCPVPLQTRYKGAGDINDAANFGCEMP